MNLKKKRAPGFSLIELLFALIIVTTILTITIPRVNDGLELHLRSSARKLSSSIRFAYNQAVTTNRYYRIVFSLKPDDLDTYWVEATDQPFFVRTAKENEEFQRQIDRASEEERKQLLQKESQFGRIDEHLNREVKLPHGVDFKDIFVAHQSEPVENGNAYLHFFPNGLTQRAVINIVDEDGNPYSLEVFPLTGKIVTRREYLEYDAVEGF